MSKSASERRYIMKKSFLRRFILCGFTASILIITAIFVSFNVSAAELVLNGSCGESAEYRLYADGSLVISGSGEMSDYSSPSYVPWNLYTALFDKFTITSVKISEGITSVGDNAFADSHGLTSVSLSSTVTDIGASAFEDCIALTEIILPSGMVSIGERAFYSCTALRSAVIPDSLTTLGGFAFSKCTSLTSVSVGNSLPSIEKGTFEECTSLTSINIGSSVASIGERAFTNCRELRTIELPASVKNITPYSIGYFYHEDPENHVSGQYLKFDFLPEIRAYIPSVAEQYAAQNGFVFTSLGVIASDGGMLTETASWSINTTTGALTVTGIGQVPDYNAFFEAPWALYSEYILTAVYEDGITNIGASSFNGCIKLTAVNTASSVSKIGAYAFANSGLTGAVFTNGLTDISNSAFDGCLILSGVTLPETLESIDQFAFRNTPMLKTLYIPESVSFIGTYAIGFDAENSPISEFTITGIKDSVAHNYAEQSLLAFQENGYISVKHPESGSSVSVLGNSDSDYTLSFNNSDSKLDDILIAKNEYTLVYDIQLMEGTEPAVLKGECNVKFPLPENINANNIRLYFRDENGAFSEINFTVKNGFVIFSCGSLGRFVITNADFSQLYDIKVSYVHSDRSEAAPSKIFRGTNGAEFEIVSDHIDGYTPKQPAITGVINGKHIDITVEYLKNAVSDSQTVEPSDTGNGKGNSSLRIVLLIVEIILFVGIISAVVALVILNLKRRKDEKHKSDSRRKAIGNDQFSDTIIIPDAPTREIDIKSLFTDDPEEDLDAESRASSDSSRNANDKI